MNFYSCFCSFAVLMLFCCGVNVNAQQTYINNKQIDCYNFNENTSFTNGFSCSAISSPSSSLPQCVSYLLFRSRYPYESANDIGYLLNADVSSIADLNNITDVDKVPVDTRIIVPVNCSCSGSFYQHIASYTLKYKGETYFSVANDTFQGLTTCQALMNSNKDHDSRNLTKGLHLNVPLRCACPSAKQTAEGFKFLLSYLITWAESVSSIAKTFEVDEKTVNDANELNSTSIVFPFTTLLVPLKKEPAKITEGETPPSPPPVSTIPIDNGEAKSSKKWVFIGVAIGLCSLVLFAVMLWFMCTRRRSKRRHAIPVPTSVLEKNRARLAHSDNSVCVSPEGVRLLIDSMNVYKFEELKRATGDFSEENRIKGTVFHGVINGDNAAIKCMKGDVSSEINILKQINHSSVVRLSGFCINEGHTFLVYEFAENGSLSDWLHKKKKDSIGDLEWKERVQIAYDIADGLNYLHNYTDPPYIHKDLKSSNILLTSNFRAKISNFGLARTLVERNGELQLTRHVLGTKGYMAKEYLENGVITPKLDVFGFGVIMLELISGKEAAYDDVNNGKDVLLNALIKEVLGGENVREKLTGFIDVSLRNEYPLNLAFSMAELAMKCVDEDVNTRPSTADVFMAISKILSLTLDWDPSDELNHSRSLGSGR